MAVAVIAVVAGGTACTRPDDGTAPAPRGSAETATQLSALTVGTANSMRGYSRARFPHWRSAGSRCDVRDTVLQRDGEDVRLRGCNVTAGRWFSRYDGTLLGDPGAVDIDHMVPLANAWRSGADGWTDERRGDFANDLTHPQLFAVSATSNRAKGDQDPSQWKPPRRDDWCRYAQDWITVKYAWRLTVTAAEKTALIRMLETCRWPSTGS